MFGTLKIIGHFLFQVVVGAILFAIMAGVAVLISLGARWIESFGISYWIVLGCHVIEYLLFLADMVCFVFFIFVEVWKLLKEIAASL